MYMFKIIRRFNRFYLNLKKKEGELSLTNLIQKYNICFKEKR